jgi:hypothetical protein
MVSIPIASCVVLTANRERNEGRCAFLVYTCTGALLDMADHTDLFLSSYLLPLLISYQAQLVVPVCPPQSITLRRTIM